MTPASEELLRSILRRRFPNLDLRLIEDGEGMIVRYAVHEPLRKGRRFVPLFRLRYDRQALRWRASVPEPGGGWISSEREIGLLHSFVSLMQLIEPEGRIQRG
jgi:hypothetical protein